MSGFLSDRYLQYLDAKKARAKDPPIDHDRGCGNCGYNLRGKHFGDRCPECGSVIEVVGGARDELLAGPYEERRHFRTGLAVVCACLLGAVLSRLVTFVAGFTGLSDELRIASVALGLTLCVAWAGAAWALTPRRLAVAHRNLRPLRWVVRLSQPLWLVAYTCWLVGVLRQDESLVEWGRVLRLAAGIGAIVLAWQLWWLAHHADREIAARRINAFVWLITPVTLLSQVFPLWMPWYLLTPLGIFLGLWAWVMLLFAMGVFELHHHVRFAMAHQRSMGTRNDRVAQTRQALDRQLESSMRPLPPPPPDIQMPP